jgi:hypothetical protein
MKLLLDENLPHQLRHEITGHDCATIAYMGWSGIENGELLSRAASAGFDGILTKDEGMEYELNLVNSCGRYSTCSIKQDGRHPTASARAAPNLIELATEADCTCTLNR